MDELADKAALYGNHFILENLKEFSMDLKLLKLFKNAILSDNHEAASVVKEMMDENYVTVTQDMMDLVEERKVTKMVDLINPGNCNMDQMKNNYLRKDKENYTITGKLFVYVASLKLPQINFFQTRCQRARSLSLIQPKQISSSKSRKFVLKIFSTISRYKKSTIKVNITKDVS